ncbi:ArsI/CadI family heavy metal resistance metalloenzyme [Vampirovibrio sp.]|uniref:ArsI/CadI family heavy metal resistance metalloenzyme n=1 Tax=Vampirovibrio sp. TaxID=2717857 RepID=UPI0035946E5B
MTTARVHINLFVSNLEASVSFYSKIFNVPPSKLKTDYANFRLETPALHLALVHQPGMKSNSVTNGQGQHFGVELFDDQVLNTWKESVKSQGLVPHLEEENVTCCYAVANKFWLHDPDGNEWEFWVRHDDEGETLFSSNEATRCCAPEAMPVSEPAVSNRESCCG